MHLSIISCEFSVCKVDDYSEVDLTDAYCFIGKTDEERSLVCDTSRVPAHVLAREDGWRAFRIQGVLDFSLIGILARIAGILADHHIGLFALSTFNTDYILTKASDFEAAIKALEAEGYVID